MVSGYQAGSSKVHALRVTGKYPSGATRYAKVCGTSSRDRYLPSPTATPTEITCKRCLAKIAALRSLGAVWGPPRELKRDRDWL